MRSRPDSAQYKTLLPDQLRLPALVVRRNILHQVFSDVLHSILNGIADFDCPSPAGQSITCETNACVGLP